MPAPGRHQAGSRWVVTFTPADKVFRTTRKLARQNGNPAPGTRRRHITGVRPVPSVPVRCVQVDNDDHLYLAGRTWIPTHNSTLGLDVARSASIRNQLATVIFSLEMSRNEITMRLLSAEARVPLHHMRSGSMSDDDWTKLARKMGEVSGAPLFIDDSPNMSMMEIRAKARRLKQRHDLKLVIIDYLQLMSSGKRVESRQQEVSEFSRALKLLAKELEVPVIAISQLNRGPEQRTDKKPQMSDLRESGCLTADTRVLRADTGAETTMGELYASGARDVPVWALDDRMRYVRRHLTHVFPTGVKPVYRLQLASGREVRATGNHPFLTYAGWTPLDQVRTGDRIAAPRHVPAPENVTAWDDRQVIVLAHLIGDGSSVRNQASRCGGVDEADQKFVPEPVFALPKRQVTLFLRHLWATGGCVQVSEPGRRGPRGRVYYATTSRRLADDVARLLWRYGIQARIRNETRAGRRAGHHVVIDGAADQRAFCRVIGVHGAGGENAARLQVALEGVEPDPNVDTVPQQVWDRVHSVLAEQGARDRALGRRSRGPTSWQVATILADADLEMLATNDVAWDQVLAIQPDGEEEVYDATVAGAHNFIANGIAVHNSIEQDADMVILLHREELYERESPRAGEADFIVAKHRNGPTATITVAFQGHYSRFVDMATS
jgi:replicative DNA helicase